MAVDCGLYPFASTPTERTLWDVGRGVSDGLGRTMGTGDILGIDPEKLFECKDEPLGTGGFYTIHASNERPKFTMRKIQLDGLDQHRVDAIKRRLAALLSASHPGVLKYHQVLTDGNTILVVTDRCCGDLRQFITDHRDIHESVPNELVLSLLGQLAGALAYLHGLGGDVDDDLLPRAILEPDNIMFAGDGRRVVLADFGFCEGISSGAAKAGDPAYMAPETLLRGDVTPASAVWSLGAVAYELATLRKPDFLRGKEPAEVFVTEWRPDLSGIADDLARSVLEKMLVLDPAERPTAKGLAHLIRRLGISVDEQKAQDTRLKEMREAFTAALDRANDETIALEKDPTNSAAKLDSIRRHYAVAAKLFEEMQEIKTETDETDETDEMEESEESEEPEKHLIEEDDSTDLMRAVDRNDVEAVKALIPLQGGTKMKGCALVGDWKIYEGTALIRAAVYGYTEIVELLAEKEKGLKDSNGWTALMYTARTGHADCLKLLLEKESGMKSDKGRTALMSAASAGHLECIKLLLKNEVGMQDNDGETALMAAAGNGHRDCVELLLEREGGIQDNSKWTALMIAAEQGYTDCAKLLLERESCVQSRDGWTALMWAAKNGHAGCVRLLVEKEGGMQNNHGWPALTVAAQSGYIECARLLVREKNIRDNMDETALDMAKLWRRHEIIALLSE
ncbi:Kinase, NEK [Giardia duodenalis]|uniref:Kinase, NEK n=1 Tax=Giardia intestinalis (strain ATCC 50803 / WB clone C6) TaxID=184922 RepID=A8BPN1_GIAIC|nr:Kinase, NEK [Giardia intestinalis]KAE8304376.1 Kinase, NEK [Giardia intestinalis]|eukprot:XP_001705633.1 Kinase, NEK [Giardia lamblia ATCC 50803]